jgi:hypothetical protein
MFRPEATLKRLPAVEVMRMCRLEPDPWQIEVLESTHPRVLLNCSRQSGKTTVVAILALVEAMFRPLTKVLIVSRSHRQSKEVMKLISFFHLLLHYRGLKRRSNVEIEFDNFSRIISLPCKEETIRGYSQVDLIILDEAARVPDDVYRALRPMLAISDGRLFCLSTPYGKRGFFWRAWAQGGDDWQRFEIPASQVPRIKPKFLEEERRAHGDAHFRQEYCCSFEAVEGLVYPEFAKCVAPRSSRQWAVASGQWEATLRDWEKRHGRPAIGQESGNRSQESGGRNQGSGGRNLGSGGGGNDARCLTPASCPLPPDPCPLPPDSCVGGIDFGFRNPFAAIWGFVDRDDVLWLVGEHYERYRPLSWHAQHLPRQVTWYADPSGAEQITELRCADFAVRQGKNALQLGIAAVHARLASGKLKVLAGRCPNLLAEAELYRFSDAPDERNNETPLSAHNHALDALRYLITRLDAHKMAQQARDPPVEPAA